MEIILDKLNLNVKKPEIERVQKEKQEYKLIGTYLRTRGLRLFSYNYDKDLLDEVIIDKSNTIHLKLDYNNNLIPVDLCLEKAMIDSRHEVFEALNYRTAINRLKKYKQGKIKELCNLIEPSKEGIQLW